MCEGSTASLGVSFWVKINALENLIIPLLVCCSVLAWQSHLVWGTEASELPPRLQGMKLQGMGTRTILGLHIYQAGLYLDQSDQDAERIIARDVPMAIRLVIVSKLITKERMRRYIQEGFDGLKRLGYRGKRNLLEENRDIIIAYLEAHPPATLKEAQARIEDATGIRRSLPQVRAFLKKTPTTEEGQTSPRKGKHR